MLEIKSASKSYGINFPTSLNEFTPEVLAAVTENVILPRYHVVVALCFEVKLFEFAMEVRNKKGGTTGVVPLLTKVNPEDLAGIAGKIGDKVVLDRTSIERGHKLSIPIMISTNNATNYLKSDEKLLVSIIKGTPNDPHITDPQLQKVVDAKHNSIFIVEFKIVALNDIVAYVPVDSNIIDPFKTKSKELVS